VPRKSFDSAKLWHAYAHEHTTSSALAKQYKKSTRWIREHLDTYRLPDWVPAPRRMCAVMDATRVGESVFLVVRDSHQRENVWCRLFSSETTAAYQIAYQELVEQGFEIVSITGDGRVALSYLFPGIPIQMCHFHQKQIIVQCTTLNPKLVCGQEILALVNTLTTTDEPTFTKAFRAWCDTWHDFLNEKTINPDTGRTQYTHRNLRRARTSLKTHLPVLFTYQKYPDLHIPNTTNSLEGSFAKVKTAVRVHTGLRRRRLVKLVRSLIQK
jgi:hypothetical protein